MINKKCISSVVAIALLLVVSVVAVVNFQGWFHSYSSQVFSDVETRGDISSLKTGIDNVIGSNLYFINKESSNLSITKIKVGDVECSYSGELNIGIHEIDISDCIKNNDGEKEVVVYTNQKIYSKFFILKYSCSGYCTMLNVSHDLGMSLGQQVNFRVNFSTLDYTFSGIGLSENYIGRVIWNSSDLDSGDNTRSMTFFDYDLDGVQDEVIVGVSGDDSNEIKAFDENGFNIWNYSADGWTGTAVSKILSEDVTGDNIEEIIICRYDNSGRHDFILNTSGNLIINIDNTHYCKDVMVKDLDGDNIKEIIFGRGGDYFIYDSSFDLIRSGAGYNSGGSNIEAGDLDDDGIEDDILLSQATSNYNIALNGSDEEIWNITIAAGTRSIKVMDLDNDGINNEVVFGGSSNSVAAYKYNGTDLNSLWSNSDVDVGTSEIVQVDIDSDGFEDDIIVSTTGSIWAINNSGDSVWGFTDPEMLNSPDSLSLGDVDSDGILEIVAGGDDEILFVLELNGSLSFKYDLNEGPIGGGYSESPATDIGDINSDGSLDIGVVSRNGFLHIIQSVDCEIVFDDGTYDLNWNNSAKQWQYNRSFSSSGNYDYSVSCSKTGYQSQNKKYSITIS